GLHEAALGGGRKALLLANLLGGRTGSGTLGRRRFPARLLERGLCFVFRVLAASARQALEEARSLLRHARGLNRLALLAEEGRKIAPARLHPVEIARNE